MSSAIDAIEESTFRREAEHRREVLRGRESRNWQRRADKAAQEWDRESVKNVRRAQRKLADRNLY